MGLLLSVFVEHVLFTLLYRIYFHTFTSAIDKGGTSNRPRTGFRYCQLPWKKKIYNN